MISLLIVLIIRIAVRQGHLPLRNVSNAIKNITSENLDARLEPTRVPIELEQLVISFNHMIGKIEDVFTRQANFSADIAHEIRTPITNLVTQTEIALSQDRTQKELEDVLYSSLEEYNRMTKMVSDMLFLAQADNNQLIPDRVRFDLRAEVMKVFEFFEAWAEERNIMLKFNGMPCLVEGDPQMFRRAINNLLSNALRYTPEGQAITVSIREQESFFDLVIDNPGNQSLKSIYQGCLTVFIGGSVQTTKRRRQRHRPCDCEVNRGSTSRKSAGGIGRTLNAFYLIRAQTGENDSGHPVLGIKI